MRNIKLVALIGRLKTGEAGIWGTSVAFWFPGAAPGFGYSLLRNGEWTHGLGASTLYSMLEYEPMTS